MMHNDSAAVTPHKDFLRRYGDAIVAATTSSADPYYSSSNYLKAVVAHSPDIHLVEWLSKGNKEKNLSILNAVITKISNLHGNSNSIDSCDLLRPFKNHEENKTAQLIENIKLGISLIPSENIRTLAKAVVRVNTVTTHEIEKWAEQLTIDTGSIKD